MSQKKRKKKADSLNNSQKPKIYFKWANKWIIRQIYYLFEWTESKDHVQPIVKTLAHWQIQSIEHKSHKFPDNFSLK